MKRAVSVSLGSSARDKCVELDLLGETAVLERLGTDGDTARATALFSALDGRVDAFGVGGIDLWIEMDGRKYPIRAGHKLVRVVRRTPLVDGSGLKNTLERGVARSLVSELGHDYQTGRVLLTAAVDRYGMTLSFFEQGYDVVCADLMFVLGIPIAVRSLNNLKRLASLLVPVASRLPIQMLYPTGHVQNERVPRFQKWYDWADVIAGDCHYIKRHMPDDLQGKVIVTNTTTSEDMTLFRKRGVRGVLTTTPRIDGRSFGTNALEAALTAVAGTNRALTHQELDRILQQSALRPHIHRFRQRK